MSGWRDAFPERTRAPQTPLLTRKTPGCTPFYTPQIKLIAKSGRKYAVAHKDAIRAGESKSVQPNLKATQAGAVLATFVTRGACAHCKH